MIKFPGDRSFREVARFTQDCGSICTHAAQYCLEMGGSHVSATHMRMLQDCADICEATSKLLLRSSPQITQMMSVCASLCEQCAASCDKLTGDTQMKTCADECRRCAAACRQI